MHIKKVKLFQIREYLKNPQFLSICLIAITLPLSPILNTASIILAFLIAAKVSIWDRKFYLSKNSLVFIIFFGLFIISLLITDNRSRGLRIIEQNLSYVILPFIFSQYASIDAIEIRKLLKIFSFSVICTSAYILIWAIYMYLLTFDSNVFYYHEFVEPIDFHPIYLSIFVFLSLLIQIYYRSVRGNYVFMVIVLFHVLILLLLSSKSVLLYSLALSIFYAVKYSTRSKQSRKTIFGLVLLLVLLITQFKFVSNRFYQVLDLNSLTELKEDRMTDFQKVNGLTVRLMFVKYAIQEFVKKPSNLLFGVGVGDRENFLNTAYEKHNMARTIGEEKIGYYNYNSHNQYVEILLGFGVIGLLYFLFMIVYLYKHIDINIITINFYGILLWGFCFEAFINRNKGIVLFIFWSLVFLYSSRKLKV